MLISAILLFVDFDQLQFNCEACQMINNIKIWL